MTSDYAWAHREGRNTRYDNKRVGGTVCVHFIKKNMWFLETALTFLGMQETTELEMHPSDPNGEEGELMHLGSANLDPKKSPPRSGTSSEHLENLHPVPVDVEPDLVDLDIKKEHNVAMRPSKNMHVLVQGGGEELYIGVEGGEGARSGSAVPPADELEWSEGVTEDDRKRGVDSDAREERSDEGTRRLPPADHFANGSRRVNNR